MATKELADMSRDELEDEDVKMTEAMEKLTPERVLGHPDVALTKGIIRDYRNDVRAELKRRNEIGD